MRAGTMKGIYFNHTLQIAESRRDRGRFVAQWWRIYAGDPRWVPPDYPTLRRALEPTHNNHIARLVHAPIYLEALSRGQASSRHGPGTLRPMPTQVVFERPVAATVALLDPRREDGTAYLALLHCVNDPPTLSRLLDCLSEVLWPRGCRRPVAPPGDGTAAGSLGRIAPAAQPL